MDTEGHLLQRHCTLDDGNQVALLDVVEVNVSEHQPKPYQPENWVLGSEQWKLIKRLKPEEAYSFLREYLASGPELFGNESDRVDSAGLQDHPISKSLVLIKPTDISFHVTKSFRGNRQARADFNLDGINYDLAITDVVWEERLKILGLGRLSRETIGIASDDILLFTISLAGPLDGKCFKLIAGIICIPNS